MEGYTTQKLYVVIEEDHDENNPYREKVYGYYLDKWIAKNEVKWLKQIGIQARISTTVIDTRRL